jgi:rpsU-divergently transcribed protein
MRELRDKLFDSAVKSQNNWDNTILDELCLKHTLTQETLKIVLQRGIESLADEFFIRADTDMLKIISDDFHKLPIHLQVSHLLKARLIYMNQNKVVALKILNMKTGITYKLNHILEVADLIWKNVKHNSSSFDYYTRRMILANVYKNCLFYFKKDPSAEDMMEYMQEQLKVVGKITKLKKKICKSK